METIDTSAATLAETLRGPGKVQARADLESEFQAAAKPFADDDQEDTSEAETPPDRLDRLALRAEETINRLEVATAALGNTVRSHHLLMPAVEYELRAIRHEFDGVAGELREWADSMHRAGET